MSYRYLFGPVPSRRLGLSLGVDLNPRKVCTENCVFCQVGRTTELTAERKEWVPVAEVLGELERWMAAGGEADFVTLSGSGEPTLHSRFGDVLRRVRDAGRYRTALLSNGTLMWRPEVRRDAAEADVVKVTLSAWDEESFRRLHQPADGVTFERLLEGEMALREEFRGLLWVEVMVLAGFNDEPEQLRAIAGQVARIRPDAVHLNTTLRPPQAGVAAPRVPEELLRTVAAWFTPPAEIPVFSGRSRDPGALTDQEWIDLLARHPIALEALAQSAHVPVSAVEARLAPLVAGGRVAMETRDGVRMVQAAGS